MLYTEVMADCFNNCTDHSRIVCRQSAELLVLNLAGPLDFKVPSSALIVTT
jgi:hypothetical protein